ncbi:MAG: alpha-L-arabinofuranosidase [Planctomycetota bacterium]|nr:MAG: alpha-L-arabinofuranosidase [Planctomycetota bacterium]
MLLSFSLLLLTGAGPLPEIQDPQEKALTNGSFEELEHDHPAAWFPAAWAGKGKQSVAESGRSGAGVVIRSQEGADIAWSQTVDVLPFARYRLEGWIRTEQVIPIGGHGALLNVHGLAGAQTTAITGDQAWTRVAVEFETGPRDRVQINCLFGGWGLATGTAYYDDIDLLLLDAKHQVAPFIEVDARNVGEPISEYIYGQFIEHLGRCIYGGIWAELLEDRKFFYPVGTESSPWHFTGSVTMDSEATYVGEHSVRIDLSPDRPTATLEQRGLGLIAGREYTGHLIFKGSRGIESAELSLGWGSEPDQKQTVVLRHQKVDSPRGEFRFISGGDCEDGFLRLTLRGSGGTLHIGTISLMPADNVQGFRADTLELLRRLDAPVYRWPGGNFVSGYDWRDGIGERDRRPPRKNPAWQGVEHNDVGIHEFMALCELLDTEPYIAINAGLGSVESAAQELEYLNGEADTPMGKLRAANGRRDPWKVRFIGVGNEMYGGWQLGHIPLADYVQRHNEFVEALRRVDPEILIIGVGAVGEWSRTMLQECAEQMDYLSEHVYWQEQPGLLAHVLQAPDSLRRTAEAHRAYRRELPSLQGRDIRICEDEWNYWYGPHVFGELGTRYFLKDALGVAAALHEFGRNSDLYFMANYAQTVNVIGAIKTSDTSAAMESTGLVLELYRRHFGIHPCSTKTNPRFDALAAWSEDRKHLTLGVVNPSRQPAALTLKVSGAELAGSGIQWQIAGSDPESFNDPSSPDQIQIREIPFRNLGDQLQLPACSVNLFRFDLR